MVAVFLSSLLIPMALGLSIAFSLVVCGLALMLYMGSLDNVTLAQTFIDGTNTYSLLAIPFFILAGELMNASGLTHRIVGFFMGLVGHIRGGLGFVVILGAVLFAGLSGSAIADTAAIGTILIPMMRNSGYNAGRATGLVCASGIIGPIIPPSVGFIIFGVTAGVSIGDLFMGGLIPGLLFAVALMVTWSIVSRKDNVAPLPKLPPREVRARAVDALWALLLPILVVGGLRFGFFTPTEGGVIAVFYALIIGVAVYREISFRSLYDALLSTSVTTGLVMFIVGAASVTSWYITVSGVTRQLGNAVAGLFGSPTLLMLVIVGILFVVGALMDITPATLILVPIFMPVVEHAGIDPVYFGIIFMVTLTIGLITPPIGVVLYTGMRIGDVSMAAALRGIWPFLLAEIVILLALVLFPPLLTVPLNWLL